MREINVKLWRDDAAKDWSIEINGLRHDHVCAQEVKNLVEAAMVVAERSLLVEQQGGAPNRSEIISELNSASTNWVEITEPQPAVEHQLDKWIKQVSETNDELATALNRLKHSFELLLLGQQIADPTEVLAQVKGALKSASMAKNVA